MAHAPALETSRREQRPGLASLDHRDTRSIHFVAQDHRRSATPLTGTRRSTIRAYGNPPTLPFFGGVKRRIGFLLRRRFANLAFPSSTPIESAAPATHIADQNGELSLRAGAPATRLRPFNLHVPQVDDCGISRLSAEPWPGSLYRLESRRRLALEVLAAERFGQLSQMIRDSLGLRCVVNYGPGEDDLALASPRMQRRRRPCALQWSAWSIDGSLAQRGVHRRWRHRPASSRDRTRHSGRRSLWPHGSRAQRPVSHESDIVLRAPSVVTTHSRNDQTHPSMLQIQVDRSFRRGSPPPRSRSHELRQRFLCPLARAPRLSACHSRFVVRAPNSPQHSLGSASRSARLIRPRKRRRPSSQAGSAHGHRSLCLYAQSALSRQRHSCTRSRRCRAFLDIGGDSVRLILHFFIRSSCAAKKQSFASITAPLSTSTPAPCRCFFRG